MQGGRVQSETKLQEPVIIEDVGSWSLKAIFIPHSDDLLVVHSNGVCAMWDALVGKNIFRFDQQRPKVSCVAVSSTGDVVATLQPAGEGCASNILLWNPTNGRVFSRIDGNIEWAKSVAVSPNGESVVATGFAYRKRRRELTVCLWKSNGERVWKVSQADILRNAESLHQENDTFSPDQVGVESIMFSPDGKMVCMCGRLRKYGILLDSKDGKLKRILAHREDVMPITSAAQFHPIERLLITQGSHSVKLWRTDGKDECVRVTDRLMGPLSPDGKLIALKGRPRQNGKLWGGSIFIASIEGSPSLREKMELGPRYAKEYKDYCVLAAFSPDGRYLAGVLSTPAIVLWDTKKWQEIGSIPIPGKLIAPNWLAFSPTGDSLAISGEEILVVVNVRWLSERRR